MKLLITYLFGYDGDPAVLAPQFFRKVANALDRGDPIPLADAYEIGLIKDQANGGLLVAMTVGDDSARTKALIDGWFGRQGITPPLCETSPAKWPALRPTLGPKYQVIESRSGPTEARPQTAPNDRAASARRRAWVLSPLFLGVGAVLGTFGVWLAVVPDTSGAGREWLMACASVLMGLAFLVAGVSLVRLLLGRHGIGWLDWLADALTSPLE